MTPVECLLSRILISENQQTPTLVVLREKEGERSLTIGIHIVEAIAINRTIQGETFPRPMTHDLACALIHRLGGVLQRVIVNDLGVEDPHRGTFFALLVIETDDGEVLEIDCRPSDALALAVREHAPIYVAEHVFDLNAQL
jgi:uncharacterized protein